MTPESGLPCIIDAGGLCKTSRAAAKAAVFHEVKGKRDLGAICRILPKKATHLHTSRAVMQVCAEVSNPAAGPP